MVYSFLDAYSVLRNNLINDFLKVLKGCHVKSEIDSTSILNKWFLGNFQYGGFFPGSFVKMADASKVPTLRTA